MASPITGIIGTPVSCANLIAPGFGICSGPWGPSGVIIILVDGTFKSLTMSLYASDPPLELDPLTNEYPTSSPTLTISSASLLMLASPM